MSRICFVSYEIHPTTWGGCGVLLHNIARLLLADGHEVIFLLDVPIEYFDRFQNGDRLALPSPECCRAYHVDTLCQSLGMQEDDFASTFLWKAYRFHYACRQVYDREHPNVIEFFDYCGVGHYALSAKVAGLDYANARLVVRLHNSIEIMDHYEATKPLTLARYSLYALEHSALRLAETVLYPSQSYLDDAYQPFYEPWLGNRRKSSPPLVNIPQLAPGREDSDIALFYGRLYGFKGVDLFVEAAVAYLDQRANPRLYFYLVGHDSGQPPVGSGTYQSYLWQKIPARYHEYFKFTGQLSWEQLRELSPRLKFGVFPSYFESFCYAAHEVYAAGVPIIVSNIPGFRDYFTHDVNALVFDGSVGGLKYQMERLSTDNSLRQRITRPYPVTDNSLGKFYEAQAEESWICRGTETKPLKLLVCVIDDEYPQHLRTTLEALDLARVDGMQIVVFRPTVLEAKADSIVFFLGERYVLCDRHGQVHEPVTIRTADAIVLLRAGDEPSAEYLIRCLDILAQHPQIEYVGSWKKISNGTRRRLQTFPIETMLETLPFGQLPLLSRYVLRTPNQLLLIDLFDTNAGHYGEVAYLWRLDSPSHYGLTIPEVLMTTLDSDRQETNFNILPYLVLQASSFRQRTRLAYYLVPIWQFIVQIEPAALRPNHSQDRAAQVQAVMAVYGSLDWRVLWAIRRSRKRVESWLNGYRIGQRLLHTVYRAYTQLSRNRKA